MGGHEAVVATPEYDAIVVGAGFGGLYMLHRLRSMGLRVRGFEAAGSVGGTWYWNRYPGARCDVESIDYSYSFSEALQQEWNWSERFASQPEILAYLDHVADRFDLRGLISFDTRVNALHLDDAGVGWHVRTSKGEAMARYVVMATGCLSAPNWPEIPGIEHFQGRVVHTGLWPAGGVDVAGCSVAIVGTGSSAIQSLPELAREAGEVRVFQRTPNYSVPAGNRPLRPGELDEVKRTYRRHREHQRSTAFAAGEPARELSVHAVTPSEQDREFDARWQRGGLTFVGAFADLLTDSEANGIAAEYVRKRIRSIVSDPDTADRLCPTHPIACKRLCADSGYYEAFNRPNVHLVDVASDPIETVIADGVRTRAAVHRADVLVLATGFDAMTGALDRIDIRGRSGLELKSVWRRGARAYLGLAVAGFPNLFLMTGPGSPSVLANMVTGLEQHAEWISTCIDHVSSTGRSWIEATQEAQDDWEKRVDAVVEGTVFTQCHSWYVGANVPGKPRRFLPYIGGFHDYATECDRVARSGYPGFRLGPKPDA